MISDINLHPDNMDANNIVAKLNALQPAKAQLKTKLFRELYPAIEQAIARSVPQKHLVAELASAGLQLSLGGFRALLESERKRRAEVGDAVCCAQCGAPIRDRGAAAESQ